MAEENQESLFAEPKVDLLLRIAAEYGQGTKEKEKDNAALLAWEALEKAQHVITQDTAQEKRFLQEQATPVFKKYIEKAVNAQYGKKIEALTKIPKLYEELKQSVNGKEGWSDGQKADVLTGARLASRHIVSEGRQII